MNLYVSTPVIGAQVAGDSIGDFNDDSGVGSNSIILSDVSVMWHAQHQTPIAAGMRHGLSQ
jgi:hypothetical protein